MEFVSAQVELLLGGVEGSEVVHNLREHYATQCCFEKKLSSVRRAYLRRCTRGPHYADDMREVLELASGDAEAERDLRRLAAMEVWQQYDTLHRHRKHGLFQDRRALNQRVAAIRLLPGNMESFVLSPNDRAQSLARKHSALVARNSAQIRVQRPRELLETQLHVLAHGASSRAAEILALLLVSGRRQAEILNGRSTFQAVPDYPNHARFCGALKKKTDHLRPPPECVLIIPLLCPFSLFDSALARTRTRQGEAAAACSNREVSRRYCAQLGAAAKKHFPMISKPHDLRGLYVKYVEARFVHDVAFPLLCMLSLGHDSMSEALHYMTVTFGEHDLPRLEERLHPRTAGSRAVEAQAASSTTRPEVVDGTDAR